MEIFTPEQKLLMEYLTVLRIPRLNKVTILMDLEEQEATMEMLCYIAETKETDLAKLTQKACEIGRKHNTDTDQAIL